MVQGTQERTHALRSDLARTRAQLSVTIDQIEDRVRPSAVAARARRRVRSRLNDATRNLTSTVKESVMGINQDVAGGTGRMAETAGSALHTAQDAAGSAVQSAAGGVRSAAEGLRHAPEQVATKTQGNPLAAGMIAFGIGAVVASLLPKTRPETQLASAAGERLEPIAERAQEAGRHLGEAAKDAAQQAGSQIKDAAQDAGREVTQPQGS